MHCCCIQEQLSLAVKAAPYGTRCLRLSHTKYLNQCSYLPPSWYLNKALFFHNLHPSDVKRKTIVQSLAISCGSTAFSNIIFHSRYVQGVIFTMKWHGPRVQSHRWFAPSTRLFSFLWVLSISNIGFQWYDHIGFMNPKFELIVSTEKNLFHLFCSLTW